jgi:hypothetical protein
MNKIPASSLHESPNEKLPDPSCIGFIVGTLVCCLALYIQVTFRYTIMALPSAAAIRPMGQAVMEFGLSVVGLFLGVPFSLLGVYFARKGRKPARAWLGLLGLVLSLLPLPIALKMSRETFRVSPDTQLAP